MSRQRTIIRFIAISCLVAALMTACGDDEVSHGIEGVGLPSEPSGDAIEVAYALEDGESWTLEFELDISLHVETNQRGTTKRNDLEGRMIGWIAQARRWDDADGVAIGEVEVRFQRIEANGEVLDAEAAGAQGTFGYDPKGRPRKGSLKLKENARTEGWKMLHSEYLAGFGGGRSWLPERPVRVGEAWSAETVMDHAALSRVLQAHSIPGAQLPDLQFEGDVRLERVFEEQGETLLELRIDALVERKGRVSHGRSSGRLAMGHRITGTAIVSKRTGLPIRIDVMQSGSTDMESADESAEQHSQLKFKARAKRNAK